MTYSDVVVKRITTLCDERNVTINKLSTLSGLTQSTISGIVNGYTMNTLHWMALGLDITVSELLHFPEMNETIFDDEWMIISKSRKNKTPLLHELF